MEMVTDRSASGMGQRSKRYSIYVKNKTIEKMFVDADGKFDVSDSNTMISFLKSQK
jgi:peroxiredoxin